MKPKKPIRTMEAAELVEAIRNCIKNGHNSDAVLRTRYAKWIVVNRKTSFENFYHILEEMMKMNQDEFDVHQEILFESICKLIRRAVRRPRQINFLEPPKYSSLLHTESLRYWVSFCSQFVFPGP